VVIYISATAISAQEECMKKQLVERQMTTNDVYVTDVSAYLEEFA